MNMPIYPNYYSSNPYSPFPQYNPPQASPLRTGVNGRIVNNFDEISVNDVPMTGDNYFFPKNDLSEIMVKGWSTNGQLVSVRFKPVSEPIENKMDNYSSNAEKSILERFDAFSNAMDERLNKLEQMISNKRTKKEVVADE